MLKEEEYRRIDMEEKYAVLQAEMLQQSLEMDEKMSEMENMYLTRLMEQVCSIGNDLHQNQLSYNHVDAKLDIMASSLKKLKLHDPIIEQKDEQIRRLQDEILSLKQELESLRIGFRDDGIYLRDDPDIEPKTPLRESKRYNAPASVRSASKRYNPCNAL
jgi:hypothetical protein